MYVCMYVWYGMNFVYVCSYVCMYVQPSTLVIEHQLTLCRSLQNQNQNQI